MKVKKRPIDLYVDKKKPNTLNRNKMKHIRTVPYDFDLKRLDQKQYIKILLKRQRKKVICLLNNANVSNKTFIATVRR